MLAYRRRKLANKNVNGYINFTNVKVYLFHEYEVKR